MQDVKAPPGLSLAERIKAILIGSSGNLVEWYDFYAYTAFALYFAPAFFPNSDPVVQQLNVAVLFSAEEVAATLKAWGMWTKPAANGQIDHPSRVFLVDPRGRQRRDLTRRAVSGRPCRRPGPGARGGSSPLLSVRVRALELNYAELFDHIAPRVRV